jgi:hypothetical protein
MTVNDDGPPQYRIDGKLVANGVSGPGVYSSREILADPALCAAADPTVEELRSRFNAKIVEPS